jgi:hypothetical protein
VHRRLHVTAEWDAEGSTDVQDPDARRTFLSNASHCGTSLDRARCAHEQT